MRPTERREWLILIALLFSLLIGIWVLDGVVVAHAVRSFASMKRENERLKLAQLKTAVILGIVIDASDPAKLPIPKKQLREYLNQSVGLTATDKSALMGSTRPPEQ